MARRRLHRDVTGSGSVVDSLRSPHFMVFVAMWTCVPSMTLLWLSCGLGIVGAVRLVAVGRARSTRRGVRLTPPRIVALIMGCAAVLSYVTAGATPHFLATLVVALVLLFVVASPKAGWRDDNAHTSQVGAFAASAAVAALGWSSLVFLNVVTGATTFDYSVEATPGLGATSGSRYGALALDPNFTACIIGMATASHAFSLAYIRRSFPPSSVQGWSFTSSKYAIVNVAVFVASSVAIVLTASRLGLILVALVVVVLIAHRRSLMALMTFLAAAATQVGASLAATIPALSKISGFGAGDGKSDDLRVRIWEYGLAVMREHPLSGLGWGQGGYLNTLWLGRPISFHSTFLTTATDLGLWAGLVLIGALGAAGVVLLVRHRTLAGVSFVVAALFCHGIVSFIYMSGPALTVLALAYACTHRSSPRKEDHASY